MWGTGGTIPEPASEPAAHTPCHSFRTLRAVGVDAATATRVAELDPPGRDGVPVGPGVWETSGIIDTSAVFGADTWLADVQAHPPTAPPAGPTVTVEDGQLFLLRPTR